MSYCLRIMLLQKIISAFLAVLLMATSVFFTVDKHLCEGKVWSFSYYGAAKVCDKAKKVDNSSVHTSSCCAKKLKKQKRDRLPQFNTPPCCGQETFVNQTVDQEQNAQLDIPQFNYVQAHCFAAPLVDLERVEDLNNYYIDPPPILELDKQALFQVYII